MDTADYTIWRDTFGLVDDHAQADGNSDGKIDEADFENIPKVRVLATTFTRIFHILTTPLNKQNTLPCSN